MSFAWKGFHSFGGGFSPSFGPSLTGGITPIGSWDASTSTLAQLAALVSHSRTSLATMFDSTGKLTYAPNNLLLNTATLGTQTVTVQVGVNYILSIKGTGSVTLTGASTAGPLNGTGASNRVDLKITAATSSLTLTVSGSVTSARLSAVTYETAFRSGDDVDTTSSAYYGPRIDYDPNTLAVKGLLIEESRTNRVYPSTVNASWSNTGSMTVAYNDSGTTAPDGTQTATLLTATGSNGYVQINAGVATSTSAVKTSSIWIKRKTGTGGIDLVDPALSAWTAVGSQMGAGWTRVYITSSATISNYHGVRINTNGDAIWVWGAQVEDGTFPTSYIPTTSASVTRAPDVVQFTGTAIAAASSSAATLISEWDAINASLVVSAPTQFGTTGGYSLLRINNATTLLATSTAGNSASLTVASGTWTANFRVGLAYNSSGFTLAANGASASSAAAFTSPSTVYVGNLNGVANYSGNHHLRSFAIYNQRLPDATLQARSVVGASY